jgi:dUTP pyrophosphatase
MKKGDQEDNLKIKVRIKGKFIPHYQSKQAAGCDLCADIDEDLVIEPGHFYVVPTGISMEIPDGYEAQVRPRSGLAMRYGIGVLNGPGTIDADYRGEIKVILFNYGKNRFRIKDRDRIAQLVFAKITRVEFTPVDKLSETERGTGGFGHSGK